MNWNRDMKINFAATCIVLVIGLVSGGCKAGKNSTHEEWRGQANQRWYQMRSGMMLQMAVQQFETGDLDTAAKTVNEAMRIDAENDGLFLLAGRIEVEKGHLERGYHWFEQAIVINENNAQAYYYRGVVQQRWKKYEQALESYGLAYENEKDNPSYISAQAEMLVLLDRVDDAIAMLEEKLDYFDQITGLRIALGHMWRIKKDHAKAAYYFEQAWMLEPENVKLQEELARSQMAAGQWGQAARTLKAVLLVEENENRDDLKRMLADTYEKCGKNREARKVYIEIAKGSKSAVEDWIKLGELAWRDGDYGGALNAANRIISLDSDRHEGFLLAGMVWQKRGNINHSLLNFDRAAELAPKNALPCILRGMTLQNAGRRLAAIQSYKQALERQPGDKRAKYLLKNLLPTE